ncbi:hypothetical protein [Agriterribacter sp.]|uniref:hypothetical protein n=1 Tax=Agriterribacter sp. TaxID=2821509 RepID=UPI002C0372D9|nr:hypothetical protein [Agriterribacter sp.]HRP56422.1 hypothetical protein [Agriterribacter sp.]
MRSYSSKSGKKSGVSAYHPGTNFITVQFNGKEVYTYTYRSAGRAAVEVMKKLAAAQKGLSTYIAQHDPPFEQ